MLPQDTKVDGIMKINGEMSVKQCLDEFVL